MKKIVKYLIAVAATAVVFTACKKDENRITLESGTAPVLKSSYTAPIILTLAGANNTVLRLDWTNPNYNFTTGPSSQDVSYTLEVDTTGANFSNPKKQSVSVAKDLNISFTAKDLNTILTKLEVAEDMPHNIEFRLKANFIGGAAPLYSNVVKMMITPYLDVVVPIPANGTLWLTGDATLSGYANPLGTPYDVNQKFTKVSNTLYELTVAMKGGGAYKLIQIQGDWSTQYHMITGGTWSGGQFEKRDADPGFPGPPTAGNYKISVNFKTGLFSVIKL